MAEWLSAAFGLPSPSPVRPRNGVSAPLEPKISEQDLLGLCYCVSECPGSLSGELDGLAHSIVEWSSDPRSPALASDGATHQTFQDLAIFGGFRTSGVEAEEGVAGVKLPTGANWPASSFDHHPNPGSSHRPRDQAARKLRGELVVPPIWPPLVGREILL